MWRLLLLLRFSPRLRLPMLVVPSLLSAGCMRVHGAVYCPPTRLPLLSRPLEGPGAGQLRPPASDAGWVPAAHLQVFRVWSRPISVPFFPAGPLPRRGGLVKGERTPALPRSIDALDDLRSIASCGDAASDPRAIAMRQRRRAAQMPHGIRAGIVAAWVAHQPLMVCALGRTAPPTSTSASA